MGKPKDIKYGLIVIDPTQEGEHNNETIESYE